MGDFMDGASLLHCFSYSPLPRRLSTVKPAFFASLMDVGFVRWGVLIVERPLRPGFWQAGLCVNPAALKGRRSVTRPPPAEKLPWHNSYSKSGIAKSFFPARPAPSSDPLRFLSRLPPA